MAVFSTNTVLTQGSGNTNVPAPTLYNIETVLQGTVTIPTTVALNDTINIGYLPRGAMVTAIAFTSPGIDTNNIAVLQVGDAVLQTRLGTFSGATLGTGGLFQIMPLTAQMYVYTAPTLVTALMQTVGTLKVQGQLFFQIWYTMVPYAS